MSQLCRELFPTLLEQDDLLSKIFLSTFADNHFLYDDIVNAQYDIEFKKSQNIMRKKKDYVHFMAEDWALFMCFLLLKRM